MTTASKNITVLITGCSTGIGFQTAKLLSTAGYTVIATFRELKDSDIFRSLGITCIEMDMSLSSSIQSGLQQALSIASGHIDILFHNAGYGQVGAVEDLPVALLNKQFQVNFFGVHELTQGLLPTLRLSKRPRIIINSSVLGFAALPLRSAYVSSKFALEGWADTLRLELANTPIKISIIQPGPINTNFRKTALTTMAFLDDITQSHYDVMYNKARARLSAPSSKSAFALSAKDCAKIVFNSIESETPKIRYRITRTTQLLALLKCLLPTFLLDRILAKGY